ncbi:adenylyl-sulfate kinase [Mucilaginibacter sp. AW1-7]|jgi:adenylylsulfate kinase|uniref:adenylyl-sulfate kinase n=1 Tax=unclassified Mucilaginibacter TaxID=2617802 RepID=UPI0008C3E4AF|nr:adenylyl-sulfate kinase [Mucilaginibacter sp. OK283]SEO68075.1 adenylylsulfate kinase [Mucilaginibacter sp. OK283]
MILLLCGLSGAGKTTLAQKVKVSLSRIEIPTEVIDADEYRQQLFPDLKYSKEDRFENIRRLGFIANKFSNQGIVTVISAIMPYNAMRSQLVNNYDDVKVVYVDCPLPILKARDTKGLYQKAQLPAGHPERVGNLTGVNDPFEAPASPHLHINTYTHNITECTAMLLAFIQHEHQLLKQQVIAC